MSSCGVYLSVCVSVTFVDSVKTNEHIFNIFSPPGSQTILLFLHQTIFRREPPPPYGGVECRWGRQKSRFWAYIWLYCVLSMLRPARCYQHGAAGPRSRMLWHIASSKWRSLLMARDDDEMFMTRSLNVTPKTTEQHLIACSDKSVAYVSDNKRVCSTFCTIETNCWQTRGIARPLCDSRATCYQSTVTLKRTETNRMCLYSLVKLKL